MMWLDTPKAELMTTWSEALAGIPVERVRTALVKLPVAHPTWPPTLGEFLLLCKPASTVAAHRLLLPSPRDNSAIPPRIKAKIDDFVRRSVRKRDPKAWAKQILAEAERGEYRLAIGIEFAAQALGLVRETKPAVDEDFVISRSPSELTH